MSLKLTDADERIGAQIVNSAIKVHRTLGPGLLEHVYETCLHYELERQGLHTSQQVALPIVYEGQHIEHALRLDLLVGQRVICEIKAVESLLPVHKAQLLTYLRLSNFRLGFLLNFNVPLMKHGIYRIIL